MTQTTTEIEGPGPAALSADRAGRRFDPWAHPELTAAIGLMAVLVGTLIVVIGQLRTVNLDPSCLPVLAAGERDGFCLNHGGATLRELEAGLMRVLRVALLAVPIGVGALLGAPIVARSLEAHRFATDWATPPSRVRRLVARVLPRAILVIIGLGLSGWLAAEVQWQMTPWLPRGAAPLDTFGAWGPIVPARGLAVLALAVLAGTLIGNRLVAGVVAAALGAVLVWVISAGTLAAWSDGAPAVPRDTLPPESGAVLRLHGELYRNERGGLFDREELLRIALFNGYVNRRAEAWIAERYEVIPLAIPMSALPDLERTEVAVTLGTAALLAAAGGLVVTVRRPRR